MLNAFFRIDERGSTIRREVLGGVTTFVTMAYIIVVNPAILSAAGIPVGPSTVATILTAAFGSLLMGLYANRPIAVAPYMGENAFIAFGLVALGATWEQRLGSVFVAGVVMVMNIYDQHCHQPRELYQPVGDLRSETVREAADFHSTGRSRAVSCGSPRPISLTSVFSARSLLRRQHQVLVWRTRKHHVRLAGISDVQASWIAHHFSHPGPDNHDVRTGLYPVQARFPLMRVVIGRSGIPGQHVDEADLVGRCGAGTDRLDPLHAVRVGAQRCAIRAYQTGKAVAAALQLPRFVTLHHDDRGLAHDGLGRRRLDLREVGRLRRRHFGGRVSRLGLPRAATDEQRCHETDNRETTSLLKLLAHGTSSFGCGRHDHRASGGTLPGGDRIRAGRAVLEIGGRLLASRNGKSIPPSAALQPDFS